MTKEFFREELEKLGIAFKKKPEEIAALLDAYWEELRMIPEKEFSRATSKAIAHEERFPKVPRLKELAGVFDRSFGSATGGGLDAAKLIFFFCPRCEYGWFIPEEELRSEETQSRGTYACQECKFYRNRIVKYSGKYLLKLYEEDEDKHIINIPKPEGGVFEEVAS